MRALNWLPGVGEGRRSGTALGRLTGSDDPQEDLRSALRRAEQHERMSRDEVKTEHLATHVMPIDDGPKGYRMFKNKDDG